MRVRVKFFGIPAAGVDRNDFIAEIPAGSTVEGMLRTVWDETELYKTASFMVNKTRATLKTVLNENDEVMILRVLSGG